MPHLSNEDRNRRSKALRDERAEAGLCWVCAGPRGEHSRCDKCRDAEMDRQKSPRGKEIQAKAHRKWAQSHKPEMAARQRKWRAEHPNSHRRYSESPEAKAKRAARQRQYAKSHPDRVNLRNHNQRARKASANGKYSLAEFRALCAAQSGRCAHCNNKTKLTADHITPLSRGGSNLIVNIQGLCLPCNMNKHANIEKGHQFNLWDKAA